MGDDDDDGDGDGDDETEDEDGGPDGNDEGYGNYEPGGGDGSEKCNGEHVADVDNQNIVMSLVRTMVIGDGSGEANEVNHWWYTRIMMQTDDTNIDPTLLLIFRSRKDFPSKVTQGSLTL